MSWLGATEVALLGALILVIAWLFWVFGRRRWIGRQGGTFDCSARLQTSVPHRGWVLGVARYSGDWLDWYRVFGFSLSPTLRFHRTRASISDQRPASAKELASLYEGQRVVTLAGDAGPVEMALGGQELTGLLSWLEGAPPGRGRYDVQPS